MHRTKRSSCSGRPLTRTMRRHLYPALRIAVGDVVRRECYNSDSSRRFIYTVDGSPDDTIGKGHIGCANFMQLTLLLCKLLWILFKLANKFADAGAKCRGVLSAVRRYNLGHFRVELNAPLLDAPLGYIVRVRARTLHR
jgi:hypothetical protein